jgi:hypothetical protein
MISIEEIYTEHDGKRFHVMWTNEGEPVEVEECQL